MAPCWGLGRKLQQLTSSISRRTRSGDETRDAPDDCRVKPNKQITNWLLSSTRIADG